MDESRESRPGPASRRPGVPARRLPRVPTALLRRLSRLDEASPILSLPRESWIHDSRWFSLSHAAERASSRAGPTGRAGTLLLVRLGERPFCSSRQQCPAVASGPRTGTHVGVVGARPQHYRTILEN